MIKSVNNENHAINNTHETSATHNTSVAKTGSLGGLKVSQGATPKERPAQAAATAAIHSLPKTGNSFIDSVAAAAIKSQRETGVPASATIAQAILESGWGKSGLAERGHNYFGIKGHGPAGSIDLPTKEFENGHYVTIDAAFRKYDNAAQSFADHGRFFLDNSRYHTALQHTNDAHRFVDEIAKAGYATDPHYAQSVNGLIDEYHLTRFDNIARSGAPLPGSGNGSHPSTGGGTSSHNSPTTHGGNEPKPTSSNITMSKLEGDIKQVMKDEQKGSAQQMMKDEQKMLSDLSKFLTQTSNGTGSSKGTAPTHNAPSHSGSGQPRNSSYTVRSGDSLSSIATRHGVSLGSLEAANPQIKNANLIFPGQHIRIPGSGGSTSTRNHPGSGHTTTHGGAPTTNHGGNGGSKSSAFNIAQSVLGHNISSLKYNGSLAQYLDKWPGNNVCCANFVSACLQKAGQISRGEHNDSVKGLAANLSHDSRWSRTNLANAKPGDVVAFNVPGEGPMSHVVMFAGWSNGRPEFIGSNNVNADGSQRITEEHMGYPIGAIYHYHG